MSEAKYTIDDLRLLADKIVKDPNEVFNLEPDQVVAVRKFLNPLGNVTSTKKQYVNMSCVNWREKYLRKLHMTALVGYVFRLTEEYEPEDELSKEDRRFQKEIADNRVKLESSSSSTSSMVIMESIEAIKSRHDARVKQIKSQTRDIIRKFLNRNFNFNPDKHLRGAQSENKADPERTSKLEAIKKACEVGESGTNLDAKLSTKQDFMYKYLRTNLLATYQAARDATETLRATLGTLSSDLDSAEKQGILMKKYEQLKTVTLDMKKIAEPLATADILSAWRVDPPVDIFHQFDRYLTNHYEQLRDIVQALYNEKSDFEYSIILYDTHKSPEAAHEYRVQHNDEFKTEVFAVETGHVNLIGPFKENRDRVDFYNKNTEIMKRMMEQLECDHKLGKDLMEKEVKAKKKKNIEEAGPDAPGLANYQKEINVVRDLGAKQILTAEEKKKLAEAKQQVQDIKEDYEVPDDAIQVDMFFPETNSETGESTMKKTKFYTQAERPLHLQKESPYADKYQPKREKGDSLEASYKTITIVSEKNEKREIQVSTNDPRYKDNSEVIETDKSI